MPKPILSNRIVVQDVPTKGQSYEWICHSSDITELNAHRMPVDIRLQSCTVNMHLKPLSTGTKIYRLTGDINATITVICAISGTPFDMDINAHMEVDYAHSIQEDENTDETYLLPEPIENGTIDIYESCIQELLLVLPLHTVKQGVSFTYKPHPNKDIIPEAQQHNPFSVLKVLKESIEK